MVRPQKCIHYGETHRLIKHYTVASCSRRVGEKKCMIEKTVVTPMSSNGQETEELGLKMGTLSELRTREKPFRNRSSGGAKRPNLPGVGTDRHWGVRGSEPAYRAGLNLVYCGHQAFLKR